MCSSFNCIFMQIRCLSRLLIKVTVWTLVKPDFVVPDLGPKV